MVDHRKMPQNVFLRNILRVIRIFNTCTWNEQTIINFQMQPVAISSTSDQLTELCRIVKWISSKEKFVFIQVLNSDSLQNTNVEIFLFLKCSIIQSLLITSFYCQEQHFVMEFKVCFLFKSMQRRKKISEIAKLIFVYFALFVCVCFVIERMVFVHNFLLATEKSTYFIKKKKKQH